MATTDRSEIKPGYVPATSTSPVQATSRRPGLWPGGTVARPRYTAATAGRDPAALRSERLPYSCRAGSVSGPVRHCSSTSVSGQLWRPGAGARWVA
jgi:hypothetical protein